VFVEGQFELPMANEPSVQIESLVGQLLLDVAAGVSVAEAVKQLRKAEGLTDDVEVHIAKQGQKLESNEILEVGQRFTAHFKNSHTITITFGDRIVNHVGMQQLGTEQDGLAASDILRMDVAFQKLGCKVKVIDLYKVLQLSEEPKQGEEALVLLVSGSASSWHRCHGSWEGLGSAPMGHPVLHERPCGEQKSKIQPLLCQDKPRAHVPCEAGPGDSI